MQSDYVCPCVSPDTNMPFKQALLHRKESKQHALIPYSLLGYVNSRFYCEVYVQSRASTDCHNQAID